MNKLAHREYCYIDRDHPDWPASAVLFDADGEVVRRFDEDWTDDQIWDALGFANRAYDIGVAVGESRRADAIRRLLGAESIDVLERAGVYRP